MSFTYRADFAQTTQALSRVVENHRAVRDQVLTDIGFVMLGKQKKHFSQLVRTGSSNGVTWPSPKPRTIRTRQLLAARGQLANVAPEHIGWRSGALFGGFRFRVRRWGRQVDLTNVVRYAGAFAARRPIYPTSMPGDWLTSAEAAAQRRLDKYFGSAASPARGESEFDRLMREAKARYAPA